MGIKLRDLFIDVTRLIFLPFRGDRRKQISGVIPHWKQYLGMLLGAIVAPIVMALVYFVTVLPTGLIMRVLGKDLVGLKLDKSAKSYWFVREKPVGTMKNQF